MKIILSNQGDYPQNQILSYATCFAFGVYISASGEKKISSSPVFSDILCKRCPGNAGKIECR